MIAAARELRGYRLFFPLALVFGAVAMPVWLVEYGGGPASEHYAGPAWHAHEMIYGYLGAVIAGFLTVADRGWRIIALAIIWVIARMFILADLPRILVAVVDWSFLPLVIVLRRPPLWSGAKLLTLGIAAVVAMLAAINAWAHLVPYPAMAMQTAALGILALLVIVSGRLVPGHTRAATRRGPGLTLVRSERVSIVLAAMLIVAGAAGPGPLVALLAAGLGIVQLYRLRHWWDRQVLDDPLLWGLHLGFTWVVLGLFGHAAAQFDWFTTADAMHLFLVGGAGTLALAIMMRLIRAQVGEAQKGAGIEAFALALVTISTAARVVVPAVFPEWRMPAMTISGAAWSAAQFIVIAAYSPRFVRGRKGVTPAMDRRARSQTGDARK